MPYAVKVDFGARQDPPLLKKYGVMNSGLVDATRYNDTIFDSLAAIKVRVPSVLWSHLPQATDPLVSLILGHL